MTGKGAKKVPKGVGAEDKTIEVTEKGCEEELGGLGTRVEVVGNKTRGVARTLEGLGGGCDGGDDL